MHRQDTDAFEARIPLQVSFGEPVVVSPSGSHGVVPVDDASDALAGGGKQNGIVEPDLIQKLNPSFRSRIVKATVGAHTKRPRRGSGERELDMTLGRKHAGPNAAARRVVGKMSDDRFAVLENMAIAIDDFQRFHKILLCEWKFASRSLVKFARSFRFRLKLCVILDEENQPVG